MNYIRRSCCELRWVATRPIATPHCSRNPTLISYPLTLPVFPEHRSHLIHWCVRAGALCTTRTHTRARAQRLLQWLPERKCAVCALPVHLTSHIPPPPTGSHLIHHVSVDLIHSRRHVTSSLQSVSLFRLRLKTSERCCLIDLIVRYSAFLPSVDFNGEFVAGICFQNTPISWGIHQIYRFWPIMRWSIDRSSRVKSAPRCTANF